ncbi:hypothetical protein CDAR_4421 [Caerostris darwini]|uniref:Uncharacterized protein n=1 Tax=Caerostris darwini TaxID=1538125 RepID=A0AAV4V8L7_9ARAC|nr:hypothetical protein CDAR_4421 [Caerostris darwini]
MVRAIGTLCVSTCWLFVLGLDLQAHDSSASLNIREPLKCSSGGGWYDVLLGVVDVNASVMVTGSQVMLTSQPDPGDDLLIGQLFKNKSNPVTRYVAIGMSFLLSVALALTGQVSEQDRGEKNVLLEMKCEKLEQCQDQGRVVSETVGVSI